MSKYALFIRMWVRQMTLYDSAEKAYEAGRKIAKEEDIAVEEVEP